jgi:hypothetical protein
MDEFGLDELKKFRSLLDCVDDITVLRNMVELEIKNRESTVNQKFTLEMLERLEILSKREIELLRVNHISNLEELIACDLESLIGVRISDISKFKWVREFYDLRSLVEEDHYGKS